MSKKGRIQKSECRSQKIVLFDSSVWILTPDSWIPFSFSSAFRNEESAYTMPESMQEKIRAYLQSKLPQAKDLTFSQFTQTAGGWSHEIYTFYAHWREDGQEVTRGLCLRKDPGVGLLRNLSDLKEQYRVLQALEPTPVPTPKVYWDEDDPAILGGPFFIMEKVEG